MSFLRRRAGASASTAVPDPEVRDFLRTSLPDYVRDGAKRTPGVFVEPDIDVSGHCFISGSEMMAGP